MRHLSFILFLLSVTVLGQNPILDNNEIINEVNQTAIYEDSHKILDETDPNGILSENGNIINKGVLFISSEAPFVKIKSPFKNTGTIHIGSGSSSSELISFSDSLINEEDAVIHIKGKNIDSQTSGHFQNNGTITKTGDFDNSVNMNTSNAGVIEIEEGGLDMKTSFLNDTEGLIKGRKIRFSTELTNRGKINPGMDVGKMTIKNFFSMQGGILEFDINGPEPDTGYDFIDFQGFTQVVLNGDIRVNLGFAPEIGQTFTVFKQGFSNFNTPIEGDLPSIVESGYDGKVYLFKVGKRAKKIELTLGAIIDNSYDITTVASPAEGGTTTGDGNYESGSVATVTAIPNPGYTFVRWTDNNTILSSNPEYSFVVMKNRNLTAWFKTEGGDNPFHLIDASPMFAANGNVGGSGEYKEGEMAVLSAYPNQGYKFSEWTEDGRTISTDENYEFTVTGKRNIKALFTKSDDTDISDKFKVKDEEIIVYPNPFDDYLIVKQGDSKLLRAELYDPIGRFVSVHVLSETDDSRIDTKHLVKGIYLLRVQSENEIKTFKVIKR